MSVSPVEWIIARSMTFSSSRTLPGHACSCSAASTPEGIRVKRRFSARWRRLMKNHARRGMSSIRSRSGGSDDREDVQPVVEVDPEASLPDRGVEIVVRRGDDPYVDLARLRRPDALELAFLQHAQQLGLDVGGQIADLVEEDRAAVRQLETALAHRDRAGKGAALVSEQLALDQRRRQGGAVRPGRTDARGGCCGCAPPARTAPCPCRSRPGSPPRRRSRPPPARGRARHAARANRR